MCCFHDVPRECFHLTPYPGALPGTSGAWSPAPCSRLSVASSEGLLNVCGSDHRTGCRGPSRSSVLSASFLLFLRFSRGNPIHVSHIRDEIVFSLCLLATCSSTCFSCKAGRCRTRVQKRIDRNSTEFILERTEGVELRNQVNVAST